MTGHHENEYFLPFYRLDVDLAARIIETSMKPFGIRSRPVLECSIAAVDTFEAKQAATTRAAVSPRQQAPKIWPLLLQAAFVAVLFILFAWAAFKSELFGGDFGAWILIALLLPAAMICEGLGLGKLSFLGPSSIPEPALWCAMIFVACIYGLVLVGATRGIVWSCKKLFKALAIRHR
jgi:hypothetical protein